MPVLYRFSEERPGGNGKGNDLPSSKIGGPGILRAPGSSDLGVSGAPKRSAASALSLYRSRDADYGPAFALALLHESVQAHKIEADLEKRYPEDTSVQFSYLPALRALEALNQGNPAKALEMTQVATPYDLAVPGTAFWDG